MRCCAPNSRSEDLNEVQKFVLEGAGIRGALVRLEETWHNALVQHGYPRDVEQLLGESMAATVLLATGLKGTPAVSIQLQSDGPVKLLLTQCSGALQVRGLAQWREEGAGRLLGQGRLVVNLEGSEPGRWFQGIVPLVSERLSTCLETYFYQSEQLPTRLVLRGGGQRIAGLLLQRLPGEEFDSRVFDTLAGLAATLGDAELAEQPAEHLLTRLFSEHMIRLFQARPVLYDCRCTAEYLARVVRMLGRDELDGLLAEQGQVELTCEFCNRLFRYQRPDIEAILRGATPEALLH
jgi:molecular chaperone Hsp33